MRAAGGMIGAWVGLLHACLTARLDPCCPGWCFPRVLSLPGPSALYSSCTAREGHRSYHIPVPVFLVRSQLPSESRPCAGLSAHPDRPRDDITLLATRAREAVQRAVPLRDRIPWLSKGHVALALSGGCVCPSSGSCSLWVVRVVTLIPLGP